MDEPQEQGQRASRISFALNGGLALIKLLTGVVGHSNALIADAVESFGDIFSSVIVWSGLVIAARPADRDHPYGHGKAEPLAAMAVALMLVLAAAGIAWQALDEIGTPHPTPAPYTLVVLLGVIAIKEAMYRYESRVARSIGSTAIHADAWHHRSDAMTSAAAAIGILIALIGGEGYASADDWAALAACGVIVTNAGLFVRSAIRELMDTAPQTSLVDSIEKAASAVDSVRLVEKVLARKMGPKIYIDMHLHVDPEMTVHKAHAVGHEVKDQIMKKWAEVADVLVHIEPYEDS